MLLRDERQSALNRIETLCLQAAHRYAAAAGKTADADLAALFDDLALRRNRMAQELASHIRALDDLPQEPDPDREAVLNLFHDFKALFSADGRNAYIEECIGLENTIAEAVQEALRLSFSPDTDAFLKRADSDLHSARTQLAAACS